MSHSSQTPSDVRSQISLFVSWFRQRCDGSSVSSEDGDVTELSGARGHSSWTLDHRQTLTSSADREPRTQVQIGPSRPIRFNTVNLRSSVSSRKHFTLFSVNETFSHAIEWLHWSSQFDHNCNLKYWSWCCDERNVFTFHQNYCLQWMSFNQETIQQTLFWKLIQLFSRLQNQWNSYNNSNSSKLH